MPLAHYGVAIGTLLSFTRDATHDFGRWYHGHVTLSVGGTTFASALDVDSPSSVGVSYRVVTGRQVSDLGPVGAFPEGWHELAHAPDKGALDYMRSSPLQDGWLVRWARRVRRQVPPPGWRPPPPDVGQPGGPDPSAFPPAPFGPTAIDGLLRRLVRMRELRPISVVNGIPFLRWRSYPWISSNGDNALDALAPHLHAASRIYLFGQHYEDGRAGVHDVHMNQGDPMGSQWWDDNGIWQDGAVACQQPDGSVVIWQVRFNTQRLPTDAYGRPA